MDTRYVEGFVNLLAFKSLISNQPLLVALYSLIKQFRY